MTDNKENMTYEEALKPAKKMTMNMVKRYSLAAGMSDEELSEAVKEILLQPYMENLYRGRIEPQDIAEFTEEMTNASRNKKVSIVSGFALSVFETDRFGDGNNEIGSNESLLLINTLDKRFSADIIKFSEKKEAERASPIPEPTKLQRHAGKLLKSFLEGGRLVVLSIGIAAASYTGYELFKENKDRPADKNETEKNIASRKQSNVTTYTSWAKAAERNRSSR